MSDAQARKFADTYAVVDQFTDPLSGFSGTVFADQAGNNYFAIRGTETSGFASAVDWIANVADVGADGIAISQGLALFNWLQRLYGTPGGTVAQYSYVPVFRMLSGSTTTASGYLSGQVTPVSVTGHSLGGHLAMMMSRFAPGLVNSVYTYNSPGFDTVLGAGLFPLTSEGFFDALINATNYPVTGAIGTAWNSGTMTHLDVEGDVVHNIGNKPPGMQQIIFPESANQGPYDAHDKAQLTDSLAIYDLFATIAPSVSIDTVTQILKASASTDSKSLENALDALRTLFEQNYQDASANGLADTTSTDNRETFYTNLINLQASIKGLSWYNPDPNVQALEGFSLQSLAPYRFGAEPLADAAKGDIATRYAVYKLNPFTVSGAAANDLYGVINTDRSLDLYDPNTRSGSLTEQYLNDRAAFLGHKLYSGFANYEYETKPWAPYGGAALGPARYFKDNESGYAVFAGLDRNVTGQPLNTLSQYLFGSAKDDPNLTGGDKGDKLYGLAGNDTLQGNKGKDYLEGGQGTDTYSYTSGDGLDTILDTDGLGQIAFDGAILNGGKLLFGETYKSGDGKYLYTLLQNATGQDLLISAMGGQIIVKDFQSDELGISLNDTPAPAPASVFHGTNNNDADLTDTGVPAGVAGGGVLDTNWQNYVAYGQIVYHDSALDVGGMFFLSRFGQPYPENTIFDALYGEGGDDYLLGNPGGHGFLLDGGAGNDTGQQLPLAA